MLTRKESERINSGMEQLRKLPPEAKAKIKVVIIESDKRGFINAHPFENKEAANKARIRIVESGHTASVRTRTTGEKFKAQTFRPKSSHVKDLGAGVISTNGRRHLRL